ncbi:hypothetical protein M2454_003087 [Aequitasia blattaphilus]|uniref:EVE domain-containing protein n=1 Tax=Aequitasia blattaphilus TaxID=2949332 RepID=A0ABT1EDL1_9FIRM|nr:hypothetical protein [Aequitasia blattaphilus]MCP1103736.1 hypothetical protein [Aequitasia blattaphilus]MCR8616376.1 hypothetical protein [Aequitasia blattaphilus]
MKNSWMVRANPSNSNLLGIVFLDPKKVEWSFENGGKDVKEGDTVYFYLTGGSKDNKDIPFPYKIYKRFWFKGRVVQKVSKFSGKDFDIWTEEHRKTQENHTNIVIIEVETEMPLFQYNITSGDLKNSQKYPGNKDVCLLEPEDVKMIERKINENK